MEEDREREELSSGGKLFVYVENEEGGFAGMALNES